MVSITWVLASTQQQSCPSNTNPSPFSPHLQSAGNLAGLQSPIKRQMLPARLPALPLKLFAMPTRALSHADALYLLVAAQAGVNAAAISSGDAVAA
jgi:hypothetical protein